MSDALEGDRLFSGYSGRLLFIFAFGNMSITGGRLVLAPLLPNIIESLGITQSKTGIVLSVMGLLIAVCLYPGGRMADELLRKTMIVFSLVAAVIGFVVLFLTTTYAVLLVGVALIGVGVGCYFSPTYATLSELFVEQRGKAFGVNSAFVNLGGVVAAGLAVAALAVATWRVAFIPLVVATVVVTFVHWWTAESYVVAPVDRGA